MMHIHRQRNKFKGRNDRVTFLWCSLVAFSLLFLTLQFIFWRSHDFTAFADATHAQAIPSTPNDVETNSIRENSKSEYISIFYNIYSAPNSVNSSTTIVNEQMQTVIEGANKFFLQKNKVGETDSDRTLYFQTIGERMSKNVVLQWCGKASRFSCKYLGHADEGDEVLTLQALYEHCVQGKSEKVIYMHDKGSFHESESNTYLRQFMTKAVTNYNCVRPDINACNVCSYQFSPLPFHHSPGNFWVAKCEYIRKLIPPNQFNQSMTELVSKVREKFEFQHHQNRDSWLGIDRYAQEHWAYSHPSINPCDLLPRPRPHYELGESGVIPLYLKMAPRYPMGYRDPRMEKKSDASEVIEKYSSYYLLEGNLFRWKELYNQLPPKDSWVWLWYPDGRKVKMAAFANSTVEA